MRAANRRAVRQVKVTVRNTLTFYACGCLRATTQVPWFGPVRLSG